jgi:hypothetical protein
MNRAESLRREEMPFRAPYQTAAVALGKAALSLQESKEAILILGNSRAAALLESNIHFVTDLRFTLKEIFAEAVGESEADRVFVLPSENRGMPRHLTSFRK